MSITKTPLAIAVAALLAAPVAMAQSSVTVYGKLYPYIISESGSGATAAGPSAATLGATATGVDAVTRNTGMTSANSRWGIRGKEDLGGGLKAMFQMESVVAVETGGANSPNFWSRNTFVGLESQMGTLKLGLMDTIFKEYGDTIGTLGVSSGSFLSSSNILRKPGFGTSSNARFHERLPNSVQVETARFSGFTAGLQYSDQANKVTARAADTKAISLGINYDKGPWYFAIAHEIHDDFFGGSAQSPSARRNSNTNLANSSKDTATQFTIEWRMNKQHKFGFDVIQKQYDETAAVAVAGRFVSYKNTAFQLAMENRWSDQWRTAASYVKSNAGSCSVVAAACSTSGLEGSQFVAAASYYLSKRTYAFGGISRITNGASARFTTVQLDSSSNTNPGEDLTQWGLGLAHSF